MGGGNAGVGWGDTVAEELCRGEVTDWGISI